MAPPSHNLPSLPQSNLAKPQRLDDKHLPWLPHSFTHSFTASNLGSDVLTSELLRSSLHFNLAANDHPRPSAKDTPPVQPAAAQRPQTTPPPPHPHVALETDLSMALSIPFYDLSNYSHLLNTVHLLQNSLRPSEDETQQLRRLLTESAGISPQPFNQETFNQVPQRFSQFIVNQNMQVAPVSSDASKSRSSPASESSEIISCLMGSQATIFSTRKHKAGAREPRWGRSRSRKPRAGIDYSEDTPPLERRPAVRYKQGSAMYRLRMALRRLAARLRRGMAPVRKFFVGRKHRATANVQFSSASVARKALVGQRKGPLRQRSVRLRGSRPTVAISGPMENPGLVSGAGADRVEHLTEELKQQAGAPRDPLVEERQGKLSHLSNYIAEQRHLSKNALASHTTFLTASGPPAPPPHKNTLFRTLSLDMANRLKLQAAWSQYLLHVVSQRIKLRQEIHIFQTLLALPGMSLDAGGYHEFSQSGSLAESSSAKDSLSRTESIANSDISRNIELSASKHTVASSVYSLNESESLVDVESLESVPETIDENVHKFQQVLNRRSMLGDMLDYDSDESASSSEYSASGASEMGSLQCLRVSAMALPILSRYSTIRRKGKGSAAGSFHSLNLPRGGNDFAMSRSPGINTNLHEIAR